MAIKNSMKVATSALTFVAAFLLLTIRVFAQIQMETQEFVFPQMAVGGGWESELTLVAQGADTSTGTIYFLTQNGGAMAVTVDGGLPVTAVQYSLLYRSSRTYRLTSDTSTRAGWIFVGNNHATNKGSISGTLTYRYRPGGVLKSQVGVLPSHAISKAHLPFDNTNGNKTALALAMLINSGNVQFSRYDETGQYRDSTTIFFNTMNQQALYVYQLFPLSSNTRGFITINSPVPFNMVVLNDNAENYSSSAVLPAVFERELTIVFGDVGNYHLRLIREGNILYGIAEKTTPTAATYYVSGSIVALTSGQKFLQLTIYAVAVNGSAGFSITLIARMTNDTLLNVSGKAYVLFEDNTTPWIGSFSFYAPSSAQF